VGTEERERGWVWWIEARVEKGKGYQATCLDMMIDSKLLDPRRNKDWHCDDDVREVGRDKPTNAAGP
jgi:hypothetical protein